MTALTQWQGGSLNSNSVGFQAAFALGDLNIASTGLQNNYSVLSSLSAFNNATALDQFMDISFVGAFSTGQAVVSGAGIAFYLWVLQGDGSTYGDGSRMTAGTPIVNTTYTPLLNPIGGFPIAAGTVTNIAGAVLGIPLPPRGFKLVLQNVSGFALNPTGNSCWISTYRQNTNS